MMTDNPRSITAIPSCAVSSLAGCVLLVLLAALVVRMASAGGAGQDQPICKAVTSIPLDNRLSVAEWGAYPDGWIDMPAGLFDDDPIILYTDETHTAGYVLYLSDDQLWVFPHWSFESRADANGQHGGTHDLCDVLIYDLSEGR